MEGNQMKMREALEYANNELLRATEDDRYGDDVVYLVGCMRTVATVCRAAIAKPPRNCDVGTPEEQEKRWHKNCGHGIPNCFNCKVYGQAKEIGLVNDRGLLRCSCEFIWAQMPYEEGE